MTKDAAWPTEIYRVLKRAHVSQASYVPDAGHTQLIELLHADPEIQTTVLTADVLCDLAGVEKPRLAATEAQAPTPKV